MLTFSLDIFSPNNLYLLLTVSVISSLLNTKIPSKKLPLGSYTKSMYSSISFSISTSSSSLLISFRALTIYEYDAPVEGHAEPVKLSSYNDHRMAMCAILIAVILKIEIDIDDIKCLDKSFPEFQEIIRRELMP